MATATPTTLQRLSAEFLGTFVLVFGGCGSAVLAAVFVTDADVPVGIGFAGVALAFGLTVLTMAYAVGHISGGHFNPAVTLGLAASGRFPWRDTGAYIGTQVARRGRRGDRALHRGLRASTGSRPPSRASPPTATATAPPAATTC